MSRWVHGLCYSATVGTFFAAAFSERDLLEWTGVAIAAGASIFAWGLGRYHDFRKQKRAEDHNDRLSMIEDVRAHTRILCEMEKRQFALQKAFDQLTLDVELKRRELLGPDGMVKND